MGRSRHRYGRAMDFRTASVVDLASQVRSGEVSAAELVDHALARIAAENPIVNAFVAVDEARARDAADVIDAKVAAGRDPGPLAGIPLGVKDLEDAAGFVTTHGSPAFAQDPPATQDSALVARLVAAGLRGGREDQHSRARLEGRHRQHGVRTDPQSVEPRPHAGRVVRRQRGCHRRRHGAAGHRVGWWRIDPHPLVVLRAVRDEGLTRSGAVRGRPCARLAEPLDKGSDGSPAR